MDIGGIIKNIRLKKGIKQNLLAQKCNISPAYLSKIEKGTKDPNLSVLRDIAKNLDIPLPILFFLSLSDEDIQPERRYAYNIIAPSIKSFLIEFFENETND